MPVKLTPRTDDKTSALAGTTVDYFYDVDELLLVCDSPIAESNQYQCTKRNIGGKPSDLICSTFHLCRST
jgi:hypothetical protein